jgi:hypothetical protein
MVRIAILSLIYRSPRVADWIHGSVTEFTPMIARGEAEFMFIANDPTEECLRHLETRGYKHIVVRNPKRSDEDLFRLGYGAPEYMHRVYRAYNEGIRRAESEIAVLVNSDNYFSQDWLESLEKYVSRRVVVTSTLVEPGHPRHGVFPDAVAAGFGGTVDTFDRMGFLDFAERIKETGLMAGGAYMPCMIYRDVALRVGLYPEGNLAGRSFDHVRMYGDVAFFERLRRAGVRHVTSLDSVVYHLKEGEKDDGPLYEERRNGPGFVAPLFRRASARRLEVMTRMVDGTATLGVRTWRLYLEETRRRIRRVPLSPVEMARAILPAWAFGSLRGVWRRVRGTRLQDR